MSMFPRRRRGKLFILRKRHGSCCHYCGKHLVWEEMTIDHKHPLGLGGNHKLSNLVIACHECNAAKGMIPYPVYMEMLQKAQASLSDALPESENPDLESPVKELDSPTFQECNRVEEAADAP